MINKKKINWPLCSLLIIGVFTSKVSLAQATFAKKEYCKNSEVILMTNCDIPDNYVIVGTSTFIKSNDIAALNDLSKKQVKQMRAFARRMKSCHVLVDFKGDLIPTTDKNGNPISDTHSSFYVLQPPFRAETKKVD